MRSTAPCGCRVADRPRQPLPGYGEHLLDDTRYDAPTFDEKCGRSSMSLKVNSGSMKAETFYEGFLKKFRILDQDRYTVDPGNSWFAACDPTKATLVCAMTKP